MIEVDPMDYSKFCIYHVDHPYDTIYRFMAIFRQTEKMTHLPFIFIVGGVLSHPYIL